MVMQVLRTYWTERSTVALNKLCVHSKAMATLVKEFLPHA